MSEPPTVPPGIEPPVREAPTTHRCICVLVRPVFMDDEMRNPCRATAIPDSPFCVNCLDQEHDLLPHNRRAAEELARRHR